MSVRTVSNSLIGQTLGHYHILDQLGAGGMGVVYRAQDIKLGRQVALKVLPAGSASNEEAIERFRREARTASSLNHPNICTIYGFDEHDGQLYLAMELLDGEPLDRRLSGRPLELRQRARHRRAGRRRARRGAHRRHPASRHQAGQHLPHPARPGEGARLRPRQAVAGVPPRRAAPRRAPRDARARALHERGRHHGRHHRLHVARAGARRRRRSAHRPVLVRRRALRDGDRPPELSRATPPRWSSTASSIAIRRRRARSTPTLPPELDRIISKALEKDRDAALSDRRRPRRRSQAPAARFGLAPGRGGRRRIGRRCRRCAPRS